MRRQSTTFADFFLISISAHSLGAAFHLGEFLSFWPFNFLLFFIKGTKREVATRGGHQELVTTDREATDQTLNTFQQVTHQLVHSRSLDDWATLLPLSASASDSLASATRKFFWIALLTSWHPSRRPLFFFVLLISIQRLGPIV